MKHVTNLIRMMGLALCLCLCTDIASAQTILDITTAEAEAEWNDAIFEQGNGGVSAGTGIFDPFYQIQQANQDLVSGVNTAGRPAQFQTVENGAGAATELLLSVVTQVDVGGVRYREFFLDINQTAGNAIYDILDIQMYTDDQPDLIDLDPTTRTWGASDTGPSADLIFWLDGAPDGDASVRLNYSIEAGSGRRDMRMLIPDALFNAGPECDYGQEGCEIYVYLYSQFFENDDGFEEWSTAIQPFIQIEKTAVGSLEEDTQWTIEKTVSPETWDLFTGDTGTSEYTVSVDKTVTQGNITVTGVITMSVPELLPDGDENAAMAAVQSLTDLFEGIEATSITCDGDSPSPPFDIDPGETVTCDYVIDLDGETTGTNTATAVILNQAGEDQSFVATAEVNSFSASPAPGSEPGTINVSDLDDEGTLRVFGPVSADDAFSYERTFTCDDDEGDHENTASIDETDDSDTATVTVNCYDLTVTKDANTKLTRTNTWTIDKTVTPAQWDLFTGDSGTSEYTVTWTKETTDDGFMVMGDITIANSHPTRVAELTDVTDLVSPDIDATVDCSGVTEVPADGEITCSYTADLPDDSDRANTATATLQNYDYASDLTATAGGTTDFNSPDVDVDFSGADIMEINASVDIEDTVEGTLAEGETDSGSTSYERTFTCDGDEGTHDNTASVIGDDGPDEGEEGDVLDSDDASVTVNCYALTVAKDAATSFTRDWDWDITKTGFASGTEEEVASIELMLGQTFTVTYEITASVTGFTDSDHAVAGQITVSNPNTALDAVVNTLADVVSPDIAATIGDCTGDQDGVAGAPYTITNGTDLVCDYTADLPDDATRTNTATATQQNYDYASDLTATAGGTTDYSGDADVDFSSATITEIDECVNLSDPNAPAGTFDSVNPFCAVDANSSVTVEYDVDLLFETPEDCGEHTVENTATVTAEDDDNDTGETHDDTWTIIVTIDCPDGCTLTQGYWKTHNPSFWGGAPPDDTWLLLGDLDEDGTEEYEQEGFFAAPGQPNHDTDDEAPTWFDVFWTPPQGNAYYNLAHQYMAAVLNTINGAAVPSEVQDALDYAEALFLASTPDEIDGLKGKDKKDLVDAASTLASYNEGEIGPGHCDEDGSSNTEQTSARVDNAEEEVKTASGKDLTETQPDEVTLDQDTAQDIKAVQADELVPTSFALHQNYPNPFNPTTTLRVDLPEATNLHLVIYDMLGREVARLADGPRAAGVHTFTWDASALPSGTYVYRMRAGSETQTKLMTLTK